MAIYEHKCETCQTIFDVRRPIENRDDPYLCPYDGVVTKRMITAHQLTPGLFGDCTGKYGVNGVYDRGLGTHVHNEKHRDQILKQKGFVRESELSGGREDYIETWNEKRHQQLAPQRKFERVFKEELAKGKSAEEAVVTASPASEILSTN
jgi:putative FmdB family regulatory protein